MSWQILLNGNLAWNLGTVVGQLVMFYTPTDQFWKQFFVWLVALQKFNNVAVQCGRAWRGRALVMTLAIAFWILWSFCCTFDLAIPLYKELQHSKLNTKLMYFACAAYNYAVFCCKGMREIKALKCYLQSSKEACSDF